MRKILGALFVLFSAISLNSQIRTGNIVGRVVDPERNPLSGVMVMLIPSAGAPVTQVTAAEGAFRFLSLAPAKDYKIRAELMGFASRTAENIIVVVGGNTAIEIKMEMGVLEEQVTVTAVSPIVDTKKTAVGQNVTHDILQSMPTARDPWVVLQMVPAITVDRENLGGTDSGQQAYFVAKGGSDTQNMWSVDGVLVTDPGATGSSPTYFDFDAFEEINVTTGGADITAQTGGVAMNLVTRRGGNRISIGGRFYVTDSAFQAEYSGATLSMQGVPGTNEIRGIKDYGFNLGGPLMKDKVWVWGSYGVQDIKVDNIYGVADDTLLTNYVAKINMQLVPENKFEIFFHSGNKEKFGRDASYEFPGGFHQTQRFHFGTPIWKVQDEHMIGDDLLVSFKFAYSHAGFSFLPMVNESLDKWVAYNIATRVWENSYWYYDTNRPMLQFNFFSNYFNDNLLGASHDFKFGVEYSRRFTSSESSTPGNTTFFYNYNNPTWDPTGSGNPVVDPEIRRIHTWRGNWKNDGYFVDSKVIAWAGYVNDTINLGRLNLILGLRMDYQKPSLRPFELTHVNNNPVWDRYFTSAAKSALDRLLPGIEAPGVSIDYKWTTLSPRLGLIFDLTGDGKTIAKATFARYGEFMGCQEADRLYPSGSSAFLDFWWRDNGDGIADLGELYWINPTTYALYPAFDSAGNFAGDLALGEWIMWGGYDFNNPTALGKSRYTIDPKTTSQNTWEAIVTLEREIMPDFAVSLDLTWRKYDNFRWERWYYPDTGKILSSDDYEVAGQVPDLSSIGVNTGAGSRKDWYVLKPGVAGTDFVYYGPRKGFYEQYYGADLRLTKRLSNRWMLDGSFSYQYQKQHYDQEGILDPTPIWAINDREFSQYLGEGSGKISQYLFSRWLIKMEGLYELPLGFNVSGTFTARQGHIIPHVMGINDSRLPNPVSKSNTVYLDFFGTERLPSMWNLNFRIEKMIRIGDNGKIYIMADMFNVFNQAIMNRRYARSEGTYYVNSGLFVQDPMNFKANELLNPRVLRFGVRFQI